MAPAGGRVETAPDARCPIPHGHGPSDTSPRHPPTSQPGIAHRRPVLAAPRRPPHGPSTARADAAPSSRPPPDAARPSPRGIGPFDTSPRHPPTSQPGITHRRPVLAGPRRPPHGALSRTCRRRPQRQAAPDVARPRPRRHGSFDTPSRHPPTPQHAPPNPRRPLPCLPRAPHTPQSAHADAAGGRRRAAGHTAPSRCSP